MSLRDWLALLITAVLSTPALAVDHETTLTFENPLLESAGAEFDTIEQVVFRWSTNRTYGSVSAADLTGLSLEIRHASVPGACSGGQGSCQQIYFDRIIEDGVIQPMWPGQPRRMHDIDWNYSLEYDRLKQFRTTTRPTLTGTSARQYKVFDGGWLPNDGLVYMDVFADGVFEGRNLARLSQETTRPSPPTNVSVDPNCCIAEAFQTALTHGWQFVANEDLTVTALGWSDPEQDGFGAPHEVGLFRVADGVLLGSVIVNSASELDRAYRYGAIDPIHLESGETYIVAGFDGGDAGHDRYMEAPLGETNIDPRITYEGYVAAFNQTELELPATAPEPEVGCCARWAANLRFADVAPAPFTPIVSYSPNPQLPDGTNPLEGDFVFLDCAGTIGYAPDTMICSWDVTSSSLGLQESQGAIVAFVFPQDDLVEVVLTVSDGHDFATAQATIIIDNGAPLANAINVEVPELGTAQATCRFADPGALDTHVATFALDGAQALGPPVMQEENSPSLSSGFATQTFAVPEIEAGAVLQASCAVSDGAASTVAPFTITVVSRDDIDQRETADTNSSDGAPLLLADNEILGFIESPSDIDVFEITTPDGLKVGGEFVINLKVPRDYDLVVFSSDSSSDANSSPFVNAPFVNAPFVNAPFVNVPFVNVPFVNAPFVNAPFVNAPFVNAPFVNVPFVNAPFVNAPLNSSPFAAAGFSFEDFPLSQVGLAAPAGSHISGSDIALDELGSANLGALLAQGLQVRSFSAEAGANEERVLVKVTPGTDRLFAAIVSNSVSSANAPYSLRVEASSPPDQERLIGAQCIRDPLVAAPTSSMEVLHAQGSPRTFIVTQRERLMADYAITAAEFDTFMQDLQPFLDHPKVMAEVISVPGDIYDAADRNQCRIDEQNAVTNAIRDIVFDRLTGSEIEYVQLMGSVNIIPPRYSLDETTVGYEGLYTQDLLTQPGRPIAVAFAEGNNMTDAVYGDFDPIIFRGRELPLEDVSVSRIVETPSEILAAAQNFVAHNGVIELNETIAAGYDFFTDGTQATSAVLDTIALNNNDELISDDWKGDELRCGYLDNEGDTVVVCPPAVPAAAPDVAAVNFHASYNAGLSAFGFANLTTGATAREIVQALESPAVHNRVTLSIGCHSALTVPDPWALPENVGLPFSPSQDWVQQPGSWIGPLNYGLGDDTVADRGTEGLITLVAEELAAGQTLGAAVVRAKHRYAVGLFEFDVHDEKSLIGLALFGMPQAALNAPPNPPPPTPSMIPGAQPAGSLDLNVLDPGGNSGSASSFDFLQVATENGLYFPLAGNVQGIVGRPLLPTVLPIAAQPLPAGSRPIHDVIIRSGAYEDLLNVDPVFAFPLHDWVGGIQEPQSCIGTFSPSQIGIATSIATGLPGAATILESLIVRGAQFNCTLTGEQREANEPVTGTLRKFNALEIEAQRPNAALLDGDYEPPTVSRQELIALANSDDVTAVLDASDSNGLREIVALIYRDDDGLPGGPGTVSSVTTGVIAGPGPFMLTLPNAKGVPVSFQYVDNAGNVLLKSGKGLLLKPLVVSIVTDATTADANAELVIGLPGAVNLEDAELTLDFGDGSFETISVFGEDGEPAPGVVIDGAGDAIVIVGHDYTGFANPAATVAVTARGSGAQGFASKTISVGRLVCDVDENGQVDRVDIGLITGARGQTAPPADPAMDVDADGVISVLDARQCVLACANARCAP